MPCSWSIWALDLSPLVMEWLFCQAKATLFILKGMGGMGKKSSFLLFFLRLEVCLCRASVVLCKHMLGWQSTAYSSLDMSSWSHLGKPEEWSRMSNHLCPPQLHADILWEKLHPVMWVLYWWGESSFCSSHRPLATWAFLLAVWDYVMVTKQGCEHPVARAENGRCWNGKKEKEFPSLGRKENSWLGL